MVSKFKRWLIHILGGIPKDEYYLNRENTIKICHYNIKELGVSYIASPYEIDEEYETYIRAELARQLGVAILENDLIHFDSYVNARGRVVEARIGVVDKEYFER